MCSFLCVLCVLCVIHRRAASPNVSRQGRQDRQDAGWDPHQPAGSQAVGGSQDTLRVSLFRRANKALQPTAGEPRFRVLRLGPTVAELRVGSYHHVMVLSDNEMKMVMRLRRKQHQMILCRYWLVVVRNILHRSFCRMRLDAGASPPEAGPSVGAHDCLQLASSLRGSCLRDFPRWVCSGELEWESAG